MSSRSLKRYQGSVPAEQIHPPWRESFEVGESNHKVVQASNLPLTVHCMQAYGRKEASHREALETFHQSPAFEALKSWTRTSLKEGASFLNALQAQMSDESLEAAGQAFIQKAWAALHLSAFLSDPAEVLKLGTFFFPLSQHARALSLTSSATHACVTSRLTLGAAALFPDHGYSRSWEAVWICTRGLKTAHALLFDLEAFVCKLAARMMLTLVPRA